MKSIVNKPWGSFEIIDEGEKYIVKKIIVHPGGKLSLQSHGHRSEHWLIASGFAEIIIGEKIYNLNLLFSCRLPSWASLLACSGWACAVALG